MGRPRKDRSCEICGVRESDGHYVSRKGRCVTCGIDNAVSVATQMHARQGPYYEKWLAACAYAAIERAEAAGVTITLPR